MTAAEDAVFAFSERLDALPVVHGSADFALAVRDRMLRHRYDCLAVPLPASFAEAVTAAVARLPEVRVVAQTCDDDASRLSYVPIDPSQAVIHGIRLAMQERIPVRFVDLEVRDYRAEQTIFPDPYALKAISPAQFAAAVLPASPPPVEESRRDRRCRRMAFELARLELDFERILFLPSVIDWPWIRDAYRRRLPYPEHERYFAPIETHLVDKRTLAFVLAEIPWVTHLYEKQRLEFGEDRSLGIDALKELVLEARDRLAKKKASAKKRVTIKTLGLLLQYVRNLALVRRRLRPDLFTLIEAAQQVMGDDYAITLLETARDYPPQPLADGDAVARMAPGAAELPAHGLCPLENRLPGDALEWRRLDLRPEPPAREQKEWSQVWNPHQQCSWPPEDSRIESFNQHVRDQAVRLLQSEWSKSEKFTSSVKDGIDMRETMRNWHTGDIFVREIPPAKGSIDVVVFLFDVPADPERYRWRTTWFAEHQNESTLVFFATSYLDKMIGPGIAEARYGGTFFIYPPRPILDIWHDPQFGEYTTLEEHLLAGAFRHAEEKHVAVVSPCPLKASWRKIARRYGVTPIAIPLSRFSSSTVDRLRTFHVLNGRKVRSYAANFIRRTD